MKISLLRIAVALFLTLVVAHAINIQETKIKAENGDPQAQYELGFVYLNGLGVPENQASALKLLTFAANQGHVDAQTQLGQCYEEGLGVAKDAHQAVAWYEKAALQGDAVAQTYLGMCYADGRGAIRFDRLSFCFKSTKDILHKIKVLSSSAQGPEQSRRDTQSEVQRLNENLRLTLDFLKTLTARKSH